ncbi:MAG: peptidylprolyl isomerase [Haliscomenobacter sp.]|nr:peptidylprolyl isomerase [Haliscomenobacter sp.]MBK7477527.1 peptidylprolyl isomerase [Haliscomenobacter sp.]
MEVKEGDIVRVHYTGRLISGEVFDSSEGKEPLEFEVGAGMMIEGFDQAVIGMEVGEKKTVTIAPEEGYGPRFEEMVMEFPKANLPEDLVPEPGMQITLTNPAEEQWVVTVTHIAEEMITLDGNHHLAGQELEFDIEVVEVETPEEG